MALTVGGVPITPAQAEQIRTDLGIPDTEITARLTSLTGTDDAIFLRSGTPNLVSASVIAAYAGGPASQILEPALFTNSQTFHAPTVAPASSTLEWVAAGTPYNQPVGQTTHDVSVPAGTQVGDMLVLAMFPWGTVSSVATNTAQSLTLLADYASANEVGRIYGVVVSGSVPTTITVTLSSANDFKAQAFTGRGVSAVAGTVLDGNSFSARTDLTYNTDSTDALVITLYSTVGSNTRVLTAYTPEGGSGTAYAKWETSVYGVATGIHSGSTGTNNAAVTWSESDAAGGRWLSLALKA